MLNKLHRDASDGTVSKKLAPSSKPKVLTNTPAVAAEPHVRLFAELFGDPATHAARLWLMNMVQFVVIGILATALVMLMPWKKGVPYAVETTKDGAVARVVEAAAYKPATNMLKSELSRWAERMMLIDPYQTRANLKKTTLPLRGKAVAEHRAILEEDQVFRRLQETPGLVRTVNSIGADVSQEGIGFIFVTTTERGASGEAKVQKWRFTVHYTLSVPEDEQEVIDNPAGLNITHIERVQDKT